MDQHVARAAQGGSQRARFKLGAAVRGNNAKFHPLISALRGFLFQKGVWSVAAPVGQRGVLAIPCEGWLPFSQFCKHCFSPKVPHGLLLISARVPCLLFTGDIANVKLSPLGTNSYLRFTC